jgi:arylsulfatase A-like enzyme
MFGPELDYCWSAASTGGIPDAETFLKRMGSHLYVGLGKSIVAIPKPTALQWRAERLLQPAASEHAIATTRSIHDLAVTIIRQVEQPSFAVFHYIVPHWPFIYSRNGLNPNASVDNPLHFGLDRNGQRAHPEAEPYITRYTDNLRYTDTLVGELVDVMKSAGRFDAATLVLTSDHSWRHDPALPDDPPMAEVTHVPLIIKKPHQDSGRVVDEPFSLVHLRQLIPDLELATHASGEAPTEAPG